MQTTEGNTSIFPHPPGLGVVVIKVIQTSWTLLDLSGGGGFSHDGSCHRFRVLVQQRWPFWPRKKFENMMTMAFALIWCKNNKSCRLNVYINEQIKDQNTLKIGLITSAGLLSLLWAFAHILIYLYLPRGAFRHWNLKMIIYLRSNLCINLNKNTTRFQWKCERDASSKILWIYALFSCMRFYPKLTLNAMLKRVLITIDILKNWLSRSMQTS